MPVSYASLLPIIDELLSESDKELLRQLWSEKELYRVAIANHNKWGNPIDEELRRVEALVAAEERV